VLGCIGLSFLLACEDVTPPNVDTSTAEADHALNWTCEELAEDYRADRARHPDLCEGYDADGWPVEGAEVKLPAMWRNKK